MTIERFKTHMPPAQTIVEHKTECVVTYALRNCLLGLFIDFEDAQCTKTKQIRRYHAKVQQKATRTTKTKIST